MAQVGGMISKTSHWQVAQQCCLCQMYGNVGWMNTQFGHGLTATHTMCNVSKSAGNTVCTIWVVMVSWGP